MKQIYVYSDGSCSGNPGPGGWGAVLVFNGHERELSGRAADTTNNRMELTAVIEALAALKEPCRVVLTSDSKYVTDSISKNWILSWKKKRWRNAKGTPTPNVDLWERLLPLLARHKVSCVWIKGHNGHYYNERCDGLAVHQTNIMKRSARF